jgi:hypothetical protein
MTIRDSVHLPVWLLTLICSALVGFFTYSITFAVSYANTKKDVEINIKTIEDLKINNIKKLEENKADQKEVTEIKLSLIRIEGKLDTYILNKRQ